jgi:hypothetical protein
VTSSSSSSRRTAGGWLFAIVCACACVWGGRGVRQRTAVPAAMPSEEEARWPLRCFCPRRRRVEAPAAACSGPRPSRAAPAPRPAALAGGRSRPPRRRLPRLPRRRWQPKQRLARLGADAAAGRPPQGGGRPRFLRSCGSNKQLCAAWRAAADSMRQTLGGWGHRLPWRCGAGSWRREGRGLCGQGAFAAGAAGDGYVGA